MKKFLKRFTAILTLCFVAFAALPANSVVSAKETPTASVLFGEENVCENVSIKGGLALGEAGGRKGRKAQVNPSTKDDAQKFEFCTLSQEFKDAVSGETGSKNIPDGTPIDITVEYYDGEGSFALDYDSWHPFVSGYSTDKWTDDIWASTEIVYLKNTKQWKSYTFHIEDMRMEGRCQYPSDFRVGIWDPFMKYSSADVLFGSITIKLGEKTPSAKVVFTDNNVCRDISVRGDLIIASAGGRKGRKTSRATDVDYEFYTLSQEFKDAVSGASGAQNIPDGTPIDITVEYYDGNGSFALDYNSWHPAASGYGENNWCWNSAEIVKLNNTKKWTSYTFHIEDMRMQQFCTYNSDFRLGIWSPFMDWSSDDVLFGSVTISVGEYKTLLKAGSITSERLGNIYPAGEMIRLSQELENKTDKTVEAGYVIEVFDSENKRIYNNDLSIDFSPKQKRKVTYVMQNPNIYGIYTVSVTERHAYKASSDYIKNTYKSEFSVARFSEGKLNPNFGTNNHLTGLGHGVANEVAYLVKNAGLGIVRDELRWDAVETEKGVYKIPDKKLAQLKEVAKSGAKINLVLCFWNSLYDEGKTPYTQEGFEGFANYAAFLAKELKGIVSSFEVWNEYNAYPLFNNGYQPPETYAEMLKVAYSAIKAANPDVFVWGIDCADMDFDWTEKVLAAGAYDYMDGLSIHAYAWKGEYYGERVAMEYAQTLKELMKKYSGGNDIKPIYYSEMGWSTFDPETTVLPGWASNVKSTTRQHQAEYIVVMNAVVDAYDLCDQWTQFCFYDRENNSDLESCWGLVNKWNDRTNVPSGAKPSYLSTSAYNYFAGGDAEYKAVLEDNRCYAFRYYNQRLEKDVVIAVSCDGDKTKSYYFGTNSVEIYDLFGNKIKTAESQNGIYTFDLNGTPFYITGNFEAFADADNPIVKELSCSPYSEQGEAGYNVTAKILNAGGSSLEAVCAVYSDSTGDTDGTESAGALFAADKKTVTSSSETQTVTFKIKCGLKNPEIKVFLWDFESLTPRTEAVAVRPAQTEAAEADQGSL